MANVNSSQGFVNLPAQVVAVTTATTLLVPPSTALYQGLPSPVFLAGNALYLALDPDYQSSNPTSASPTFVNSSVDGKQFKIRIVGIANVSASTPFQVSLYQGTSSAVSNDTLISISASYVVTTASSVNFVFETNLLWDSTTSHLNGWFWSDVNNVFTGAAAITAITNLTVTQLQFIPSFTMTTANAANSVVVKEFLCERV